MTNNTITFELNGKTYIDTNNNRFYVVEDGKKTRIGRAAHIEAFNQYIELAKAEIEESQTTEETQQIAKGMAPKVKKINRPKRASRDVAYSYIERNEDGTITTEITLTAKQVDFICHLSDTSFWERGLDSALWTDVLADEIGGQFAGKPMTTGAMISTICEKGLANRGTDRVNGRKATFMVLTELGKKIAAELGLS